MVLVLWIAFAVLFIIITVQAVFIHELDAILKNTERELRLSRLTGPNRSL